MTVDQGSKSPPKTLLALTASILPITCTVVSCVALVGSWDALPLTVLLLLAVSAGGALTYRCWLKGAESAVAGSRDLRMFAGSGCGVIIMLAGSVFLMNVLFGASGQTSDRSTLPGPSEGSAAETGAQESVKSFSQLWSPTLTSRSITTERGSRAVVGVEVEAVGCASSTKTFTWSSLQNGDEVEFDLQALAANGGEKEFRMDVEGAGIDETIFVEGDMSEHVAVVAQVDGSVQVRIESLHRTDEECRNSRSFLAVENGNVN